MECPVCLLAADILAWECKCQITLNKIEGPRTVKTGGLFLAPPYYMWTKVNYINLITFFQISIKLSSQPDELSGLHKEPFDDFRFLRIAPH